VHVQPFNGAGIVFTISNEQMSKLGQALFEERMVRLIREDYPEHAAAFTDQALTAEIWRQAGRAQGYGLEDEQAVATYVMTAWLLGPEFDLVPAMVQVLNAPELSAASKAKALRDFTLSVFAALDARSPRGFKAAR
jgi:hypothetical protein